MKTLFAVDKNKILTLKTIFSTRNHVVYMSTDKSLIGL